MDENNPTNTQKEILEKLETMTETMKQALQPIMEVYATNLVLAYLLTKELDNSK